MRLQICGLFLCAKKSDLHSLVGCGQSKDSTGSSEGNFSDAIKVVVCLYKFDDTYISTVRQSLEKVQAENKDKIEFTVMLEGEAEHQDALIRTEYCIKTIVENGIELEKLD